MNNTKKKKWSIIKIQAILLRAYHIQVWTVWKIGVIYSPLVAILEHPKLPCTSSCGPRWDRSVVLPSITILKLTNTTPLEIPHCHVISLKLCLGPLRSSMKSQVLVFKKLLHLNRPWHTNLHQLQVYYNNINTSASQSVKLPSLYDSLVLLHFVCTYWSHHVDFFVNQEFFLPAKLTMKVVTR